MESFEIFLEIFQRCEESGSHEDIIGILKDGRKYFQNINTDDLELVLLNLLDEEKGLLQFLQRGLQTQSKNSFAEGYRFLKFIIDQFNDHIRPYVTEIHKTCKLALEKRCSHYTKVAAADAFERLILFNHRHLDLQETVEAFRRKDTYFNEKERTHVLRILGKIAKHCPEAIASNSDLIFKRLKNDFIIQYDHNGTDLAVYLDVLTDMLSFFLPSTESVEKCQDYYRIMYPYIKNLSTFPSNKTRKVINRAAVGLLKSHMAVFAEWVYKDHAYWHDTLCEWIQQKGVNAEIGFEALMTFYETLGNILKQRNAECDKAIFEHYMNHFKTKLMEDELESSWLRLVIRGFGTFAGPCQNYLTESDVIEMFNAITRRTSIIYSSENEERGSFEDIAHYQVALSLIMLYMPNTSSDQLSSLTALSTLLVKRFPELPVNSHYMIVVSLMDTMDNIRQISRTLFQEFLHKLVYEGIIWTCSHTLLIDAELEREMQDLSELPTCYINYLPLWQQLLIPSKMRKGQPNQLLQPIFEEMILTCFTLINKLNLNTETKDDNIFSDVGASQMAVNNDDFRIFINLVDLFVDIFNKLERTLMEPWIHKFLYVVVKNSYRNPLISGFYKLVHSVLKISDVFRDPENVELHRETVDLVSQYLSETLDRVCSFSGELQITCLRFIVDAPVSIVQNVLHRMVPVFLVAFRIGQSNFDIAQSAIGALELWSRSVRTQEMRDFLMEVVPALEPFLQSRESATELRQEILKTERKVIKRVTVTDHEKTLEGLQRRMLLFLGSLDSEISLDFIYKRSLNTGASWDKKDLLKYTLPYKDARPDIYLDKILPRVIDLALSSSDRRTRVVACEMLHSIIITMLGKSVELLALDPDRFGPLFKKCCPALLKLGCDPDQVIQQLFYPLMIQITHWLSSKTKLKSCETSILIETLFESLTDESNSALRDFSGVCLAQFITWSVKQSTDAELQSSPTNILAIVRKITSFALHPSTSKRNGAAIAFNHLYAILREHDIIVNTFWLELLFVFVKSLDGCGSSHILNALSHVEKVLIVKYELFNRPSAHRRKPPEFQGILLKDAAEWLLLQCSSLDPICRQKSMELLKIISPCVAVNVVTVYMEKNGLEGFNRIILGGLLNQKMVTLSEENLKAMLRTLDCYIWLLKEQLMSLELLLTDENPSKDLIFDNCKNFVHLFLEPKDIKEEDAPEITVENEKIATLKCEIVLKIFDFIQLLFNSREVVKDEVKHSWIPSNFWSQGIFAVISACVLKPQTVGFNMRNLEIMESLPSSIEKLLNTLKVELDNNHIEMLKVAVSKDVQSNYGNFVNLKEIVNSGPSLELNFYLHGIGLLKKCDLLDKVTTPSWTNGNSDTKIREIFDSLKKQQFGKNFCVILTPDTKEYLINFMEFLLLECEPNLVKTLVELAAIPTPLCQQASTEISHGEYFFHLFNGPMFRNMLQNIPEVLETLLSEVCRDNPDTALTIMEELVKYALKHKRDLEKYLTPLQNVLLKKFASVHKMINCVEHRKNKVLSLYATLVQLMADPSEISRERNDLYLWILGELSGDVDLAYKTRILRSFLVCLVDASSEGNPELTNCLNKLKPANLGKNPRGRIEFSNVVACFQTLLELLPITKSIVVFESVMNFGASDAKYLCDETVTKYLQVYFHEITTEHAAKSLDAAFKLFMNAPVLEVRLDLLQRFMLPAFQSCKAAEIEEFFEQKIKDIYTIVSQSLTGNELEIRKLIVSKIGCYNLIEVMFARVPIQKIDNVDSKITRNAVGNVTTGKELLQPLYSSVINVRTLRSSNPQNAEWMRLLHCAAYNCCAAIISLKQEEKFYATLFGENSAKGQTIWENVVAPARTYKFPQGLEELPKIRKKLVNIRTQSRRNRDLSRSQRVSYVQSYNLASSTLNEDLSTYDLHDTSLIPRSALDNTAREEMISLTFESDDLNDHECMATVCAVLTHMASSNIFCPPEGDDDPVMPGWMKHFHSSISFTKQQNVQLFLLKVLLNTQSVFKPYAKYFLKPILKIVQSHIFRCQDVDYMVTDVFVMLIDWKAVAIPDQSENRPLVQSLLKLLILNASKREHDSVNKYNMDMIKTLIVVWKSCLDCPHQLIRMTREQQNKQKRESNMVQLILILLETGMERQLLSEDYILESLNTNLQGWAELNEETLLRTCEAVGLVLKYFHSVNELHGKKVELTDNVHRVFQKINFLNKNCFIKCIHAMHKDFPNIVGACFLQITSNVWICDESNRSKCLEMFLAEVPRLTDERVREGLELIKIDKVLQNKVSSCEKVALRIIERMVNVLKPPEIFHLASLASSYAKDVSTEYREIAYSIFMSVYSKHRDDITEDETLSKLKDLSRRVLLSGLLDPNEELQQKLLKYWTEGGNMTENSTERLLTVLDMYDPGIESIYLPIVPLMMLHLASTGPDARAQKKIFPPLSNCTFEDYKVAVLWRAKNAGSMAPLFTPSLASQMNQSFTQLSQSGSQMNRSVDLSNRSYGRRGFELRATAGTLQFEQTVNEDSRNARLLGQSSDAVPWTDDPKKIPQPAFIKKSRRFLKSSVDISASMRYKEIKKNVQREEMLKEEVVRQRSSVRMVRKYRIGDFPDTEITHPEVIVPLQELAKKDQLIAKDLTVCLFCSLANALPSEEKSDFLKKASESLKFILDNSQGTNPVVATALEIILASREMDINSNTVTRVSKSGGLLSLGALLLEEKLTYGSMAENNGPPSKRRQVKNTLDDEQNQWMQLARLYECMNEVDVVLSIFGNQVVGDGLQEASLARAAGDWEKAGKAYGKVCERNKGPIEEHCLEGMYDCLARLSSWEKIDKDIKRKVDENYSAVWEPSWSEDWIVPWIFKVQLHLKIRNEQLGEQFLEALNSWMADSIISAKIKGKFGEELAMLCVAENPEMTRIFLASGLETIRQQWVHLNPLSTKIRSSKLLKLRGFNDMQMYLKTIKDKRRILPEAKSMIRIWSHSGPSNQDDLLLWETLVSYRLQFASLLLEQLSSIERDEDDVSPERIRFAAVKQRLKLIEAGLSQGNRSLVLNHLKCSEKEIEEGPENLMNEWHLGLARYKFLCAEVGPREKKMASYTGSWEKSHKLLRIENLEAGVKRAVRQHIAALASRLGNLATENESIANGLKETSVILEDISATENRENIAKLLNVYSLANLKECYKIADAGNIADCYLKVSEYCHSRISVSEPDVELSREFVHSTLSAMSNGSVEATQYFPCLLQLEHLQTVDLVRQTFERQSEEVETWMFLSWQEQLLSYIDTPIKSMVIPILVRLTESYPNALMYTFRLAVEMNPALAEDPRLSRILPDRPDVDAFLQAMGYVVQPELYLLHHLKRISKNKSLDKAKAVRLLLDVVYPSETKGKCTPLQGSVYKEIAGYRVKLKEIESKKNADLSQYLRDLAEDLNEAVKKRHDKFPKLIKNYSPWLHKFSDGELEVPGQYLGDRRPMPRYHAKIMRFEAGVSVMKSIRKPIKITMLGNDAKSYSFLVKFGEDLRVDQRIEQLFTLMNKVLHTDTACRQRHMSIDTYQVIPMTSCLGLIQWVENTRPLEEFIYRSVSPQLQKQYADIERTYNEYIHRAAPGANDAKAYKATVLKYSRQEVTKNFDSLKSRVEWDVLRNAFKMMSSSPESFIALRHNFVTSYATMCIAQWILGIGDRHLSNTLISTDSGRSLGIDFGCAFGAGTDISIPELMPCRITPQILGLLQPFDENGLLRATMTHVLLALRNGKDPLLACMEVFIREPSLDWLEKARKQSEDPQGADVKWYPVKKITVAKEKLTGVKPARVILTELRDHHFISPEEFPKYATIICGNDVECTRTRATMNDENLSPDEQVRCLLDQATDPNILGRTYIGWQPWM